MPYPLTFDTECYITDTEAEGKQLYLKMARAEPLGEPSQNRSLRMAKGRGVMPSRLVVWLLLLVLQGAARSEAACGQPVITTRIVGGNPAIDGAWPWQVSISAGTDGKCGGSLIAEQWVLSAAHCFASSESYEIQLGAYRLQDPTSNTMTTTAKQIIVYPYYQGYDGSSGDLALIQLTSPMNFTNYILPVCLPDSSMELPPGTSCWVAGWGNTAENQPLEFPETLQELNVPIIDRETCNNLYNTDLEEDQELNPIKSDMLCAGYADGQKDACQGDSGGPLVCQFSGIWFQAGIVSWANGCAKPNHPGVYTSVPYYADWIHEKINGGLLSIPTITLLLTCLSLALL